MGQGLQGTNENKVSKTLPVRVAKPDQENLETKLRAEYFRLPPPDGHGPCDHNLQGTKKDDTNHGQEPLYNW